MNVAATPAQEKVPLSGGINAPFPLQFAAAMRTRPGIATIARRVPLHSEYAVGLHVVQI